MIRKCTFLSVCVGLFVCCVMLGEAVAEPEGSDRRGKYTYKGIYQDCFKRGAVESKKPVLDPDSKTQSQWERLFAKKDFEEFGCAEEFGALSEDDLNDILAYLWKHAADSPSPAKCK